MRQTKIRTWSGCLFLNAKPSRLPLLPLDQNHAGPSAIFRIVSLLSGRVSATAVIRNGSEAVPSLFLPPGQADDFRDSCSWINFLCERPGLCRHRRGNGLFSGSPSRLDARPTECPCRFDLSIDAAGRFVGETAQACCRIGEGDKPSPMEFDRKPFKGFRQFLAGRSRPVGDESRTIILPRRSGTRDPPCRYCLWRVSVRAGRW